MKEKDTIKEIINAFKIEDNIEFIDIMMPPYISKKLIAYNEIRVDLLRCKNFLHELINLEHNETVCLALFDAFAAVYSKCFKSTETSKSPKLGIKDFGERQPLLLEWHKEIISLKSNLLEQNNSIKSKNKGGACLRIGITDYSKEVKIKPRKVKWPSKDRLTNYLKLINVLVEVSKKKYQKNLNKAFNHMLYDYDLDELKKFRK